MILSRNFGFIAYYSLEGEEDLNKALEKYARDVEVTELNKKVNDLLANIENNIKEV